MHFAQTHDRRPLTESQKFLKITNSNSESTVQESNTSSNQQQKPLVLSRNQVTLASIFPFQEQPQIGQSRLDQ